MGFLSGLGALFGTIGSALRPIVSTIGSGIKTVALEALPVLRNIGGNLLEKVGSTALSALK